MLLERADQPAAQDAVISYCSFLVVPHRLEAVRFEPFCLWFCAPGWKEVSLIWHCNCWCLEMTQVVRFYDNLCFSGCNRQSSEHKRYHNNPPVTVFTPLSTGRELKHEKNEAIP